MKLPLPVLDRSPVGVDSAPSDAVRESVELAGAIIAAELGVRYAFVGHFAMRTARAAIARMTASASRRPRASRTAAQRPTMSSIRRW
jgi:hypothetical protein